MIGKFPELFELQLVISQSQPVHSATNRRFSPDIGLGVKQSRVSARRIRRGQGVPLRKKGKCIESAEVSPPQCNLSQECRG